jgi:hypothetical protein
MDNEEWRGCDMFRFFTNWWKSKKTFTFYLAGPMRNCPELNKPMFILVAQKLRELGHTVWSPAEHDSYLKSSFAECMKLDLNAVINRCRKIAFLPGWRNSLGANMEAFSAFAVGKEAIEVILDDEGEMDLKPVDLTSYHLPYLGEEYQFNPHDCPVDADMG